MEIFSLPDFYLTRDNELEKISFGLTNYNTVLIIGEAGIGKTEGYKIEAFNTSMVSLLAKKQSTG